MTALPAPAAPATDAASLVAQARRVTIKVGSSLLIDADGRVDEAWLTSLAQDIAALRTRGAQVLLVSSGAVALGRAHLGLRRSHRLALKQAAAAAGQPLLMRAWEAAMAPHGIPTAQLLLTVGDTESRRRWLNARATLEVLLGEGALPVINENDSVATEELRYGDNDRLSARAAQMVRSDLLILLSDVDGVYTGDPTRDPEARHIPFIGEIDAAVEGYASGAAAAGVGTGGMRTKIGAARIARAFGCTTIITTGRRERPIGALADGGRATVIAASGSPARAYKQWIAGTLEPAGTLTVDEGAAAALAAGRSLLPAGATGVDGRFERGACLCVVTGDGREIARGLCAYNAEEVAALCGVPSREIETRLGYAGPDELIHRDDMVLM